MKRSILFSLAIATLAGLPVQVVAQDRELIGHWNTCYSGSFNTCVSLDMFYEPYPDFTPEPEFRANGFVAVLDAPGTLPVGEAAFRITAWGFYYPKQTDAQFFLTQTEDIWQNPNPPGWESFLFKIATDEWDCAVGGPCWGAEGTWGYWEGDLPPLSSLRFAWRGVTQDQSTTFDCIQSAPGSSECVNVAPEPSTWALLLTGLSVLALVYRRRFKRSVVARPQ